MSFNSVDLYDIQKELREIKDIMKEILDRMPPKVIKGEILDCLKVVRNPNGTFSYCPLQAGHKGKCISLGE